MQTENKYKFIADHMLGRLTRWLRILGYDTLYPPPGPDRELIEMAGAEDRIILTRDKIVSKTKKAEAIYIKSDNLDEQLSQLASDLSLTLDANLIEDDRGTLLNRCTACNGTLMTIPAEQAADKVPEGVRSHITHYWQCIDCHKIYWEGTHWEQIKKRIDKILKNND
jgi:uncharacterized protein with PIN domain